MKVRITFTVDVDADAWREVMLVEPAAPQREVRADVQAWATQEVAMGLGDRGLLL